MDGLACLIIGVCKLREAFQIVTGAVLAFYALKNLIQWIEKDETKPNIITVHMVSILGQRLFEYRTEIIPRSIVFGPEEAGPITLWRVASVTKLSDNVVIVEAVPGSPKPKHH